jgi:hypothetical protein
MAKEQLASEALTTVKRVTEALDLEAVTPRQSGQIIRLINSSSRLISRFCARSFKLATLSEKVPGFGTDAIQVDVPPIKTLTAIAFKDDDPIDLADVEFEGATIKRPGGFSWTAQRFVADISQQKLAGTELRNWKVDYTGGYVLPRDDGDANAPVNGAATDLPEDLEDACIELVRRKWFKLSRDPTLRSEKALSYSAAYNNKDLTDDIKATLNAYKRRLF